MPRTNGRYLNAIRAPEGLRYAVLFTAAPGRPADDSTVSMPQITAFGEVAGRMHSCMDRIGKKLPRQHLNFAHLVDQSLPDIEPFFAHRKDDFRFLCDVARALRTRISDLLSMDPPEYGLCHGDLHVGNACFDDQDLPTVFDFEECAYGWRAFDIAWFLARCAHGWSPEDNARRAQRWNAFLEGYRRHRALGANEVAAAPLFPPMRQLGIMGHVLRLWPKYRGSQWLTEQRLDGMMGWSRQWMKYLEQRDAVQARTTR